MTKYQSIHECPKCHSKLIFDSEAKTLTCKHATTHTSFVDMRMFREITEQEAFERAFTINHERKSLSAYELGAYILKLSEMFPEIYSSQEAIGKRLGISQETVSTILSAYREVETQKPKLPPEIIARAIKLPERTIRSIAKAPEDLKPALIEKVTKEELSVRETENAD